MLTTEKYKLNLLEGTDGFSVTPFNQNMQMIENVLKGSLVFSQFTKYNTSDTFDLKTLGNIVVYGVDVSMEYTKTIMGSTFSTNSTLVLAYRSIFPVFSSESVILDYAPKSSSTITVSRLGWLSISDGILSFSYSARYIPGGYDENGYNITVNSFSMKISAIHY